MMSSTPAPLPRIASPHPWLDVTRAPVYVACIPHRVQYAELIEHFQAVEAFLRARPERYAYVSDFSFVQSATATQRRIVADADKRLQDFDKQWLAGMALVAKSALMRGAVTAVYWLTPPVYPYRVFSNLTEAIVWARNQLERPSKP